jgi:hypothetical protein
MTAMTGPGYTRPNRIQNCQVHLRLKTHANAENWQYAITTLTHQGRAMLDEGVNASIYTTYIFSNYDTAYPSAATLYPAKGAKVEAGEIIFEETHDLRAGNWTAPKSGCGSWGSGQTVNIYMRIGLLVSDDVVAGSLSLNGEKEGKPLVQTLGLEWSECKRLS